MTEKKPRIGKKDGAGRVAEEFAKIRKEPLPKEVFSIVEDNYKKNQQKPDKKSAKPPGDLEA
jgi:hypothetical protein